MSRLEVQRVSAPPAIVLSGLGLQYAGGTHVFEGMDVDIPGGQFVVIVGRSGSGKSTLLKAIGNLLPPTEGSVQVGGDTAESARMRGVFSYCFQDPVLLGWRTSLENVNLPLEISPRYQGDALQALRLVGLAESANRYPRELSGGMRQRVALARSLSYHAPVVILDEPFAHLDEIIRIELDRQLEELWATLGFTCILTSHSVSEAVMLADRVLVLNSSKAGIGRDVMVSLPRPRTDEVMASPAALDLLRAIREGLRA